VRYSQLKPRTVRAAILVLVQHNVLWHATSEDEGEVFEVNIDECLTRLRFGRYVWFAEQRFGTPVCLRHTLLPVDAIDSSVLDDRCSRVPELFSFFSTMESFAHQILCRTWPPRAQKVRASRCHPYVRSLTPLLFSDSTVYTQALHKLVTSCYLKPSTVLSHISPRDKRISYEAEEKAKINGFPTAKELRQAREVAEGRLKREEDEAEKVGMVGRPFMHDIRGG